MAATLKDVAQRAGVSIKTVSNVVHDYEHVTDEVRERVQQASEGVAVSAQSARSLSAYRPCGRVGFCHSDLSNPYFSDVGTAIIAAAAARSYTVLIDCTGGERDNELRVLDGLRPHLIDGVILSPLALEPGDLQARQGQARWCFWGTLAGY